MGLSIAFRCDRIMVALLPLVLLCACGMDSKSAKIASHKEALKEKQEVVADLNKQLADLTRAKQAEQAKLQAAQKQLPVVLAQTDNDLRLATQYRTNAAKLKNPQKKADLHQRAEQAQEKANLKSAQLIEMRAGLYTSLDRLRILDKQIKVLTMEKDKADRLAKSEAEQLARLSPKQNNAKQPEKTEKRQATASKKAPPAQM